MFSLKSSERTLKKDIIRLIPNSQLEAKAICEEHLKARGLKPVVYNYLLVLKGYVRL